MRIDASRRALLAGSAAGALLPFVRLPEARAAKPGFLTFGLSSFPVNELDFIRYVCMVDGRRATRGASVFCSSRS